MNDDFLHQLRKTPPPAFAARLKSQLQRQAAGERRFAVARGVLFGLFVGASAVAATLWTFQYGGLDRLLTLRERAPREAEVRSADDPIEAHRRSQPETAMTAATVSTPSTDTAVARTAAASAALESANVPDTSAAPPGPMRSSAGNSMPVTSSPTLRVAGPAMTRGLIGPVLMTSTDFQTLDTNSALQAICDDTNVARPVVAIVTRTMTDDEIRNCHRKYFWNIAGAKIGSIGLAVTAARTATPLRLTPRHLFLALARRVPDATNPNEFVENRALTWNQIESGMELRNIVVFGPDEKAALRPAMLELIMEVGCETYPSIRSLKTLDPALYNDVCHTIRSDGVYAPAVEHDTFITQTLWAEPNAIAVLSLGFFASHAQQLAQNLLEGVQPTTASIADGTYSAARPVVLYSHVDPSGRSSQASWFLDTIMRHAVDLQDAGFVPLDPSSQPVRLQKLELPRSIPAAR
ncbi:MAG TPA: substrate-binding domain-containing protein [Povalibacter sp.]|uniref:substrate-binding domain-containing protein n=1 Tax=Povalibacter sp. TaxID=1962978 RepID=UPI002C3AEDA0|nr:substrate-binding domain-containing protein [Povalibacter sp.]HMN47484.1 substrate-binding domain-containing protein [Povalibacter sp.]